jgi:cytochrome c oxidase cbb3-type subunit II
MATYRMVPRVQLIIVEDQQGILWHHYNVPAAPAHSAARTRGPVIEWLNEKQRAHFLRLGLVTEIDAEPAPTPLPEPVDEIVVAESDDDDPQDAAAPDSGAVDQCVATLAGLQVPATAGAPTARTALRGNGFRFGNDIVAAAVRARKSPSGTAA